MESMDPPQPNNAPQPQSPDSLSVSVGCEEEDDLFSEPDNDFYYQQSHYGLTAVHQSATSALRVVEVEATHQNKWKKFFYPGGNEGLYLPQQPIIHMWMVFSSVCIVVSCYLQAIATFYHVGDMWIVTALYVSDAVFLVEVAVNFNLAYTNTRGMLISDRHAARKRYMKTQFIADALSLLPLEALAITWMSHLELMTFVTQLRVNRLIRYYKPIMYVAKREAELGHNELTDICIKYFLICTFGTHIMACIWFQFACNMFASPPSCSMRSWSFSKERNRDDLNVRANMSKIDAYIISLYWAVATATSTGYGDISAAYMFEKIYATLAMVAGIGMYFGMLLGGLTSVLTNLDQNRAHYVHRFNVVQDEIHQTDCGVDLRDQVIGYYEYIWVRKKAQASFEDLYKHLPFTVRGELSMAAYQCILDKAHLFDGCPKGFMRMLCMCIKPKLYLPHQIVVARGDVDHEMYFIHSGEVDVLSEEDDDTPIATLKKGKIFGEICLMLSVPRTVTIRAATHCDLMVLHRRDLQTVFHQYPSVMKHLQEVVRKRCINADEIIAKRATNLMESKYSAFKRRDSAYISRPSFSNHRKSFTPMSTAPRTRQLSIKVESGVNDLEGNVSTHSIAVMASKPLAAQRRSSRLTFLGRRSTAFQLSNNFHVTPKESTMEMNDSFSVKQTNQISHRRRSSQVKSRSSLSRSSQVKTQPSPSRTSQVKTQPSPSHTSQVKTQPSPSRTSQVKAQPSPSCTSQKSNSSRMSSQAKDGKRMSSAHVIHHDGKGQQRRRSSLLMPETSNHSRTARILLRLVDKVSSVTIPPDAAILRVWKVLLNIAVFTMALVFPYQAAFAPSNDTLNDSKTSLAICVVILTYMGNFMFLTDIVINLRTGIATPYDTLTSFKHITYHYCRSWRFAMDLCSVIPLESVRLFVKLTGNSAYYPLLHFNRLVKLFEIPLWFKNMEDLIGVNVFYLRSAKCMAYTVLASHWTACIMFYNACPGHGGDYVCDLEKNWFSQAVQRLPSNTTDPYFISLYFAVATMTSTGYGDIHADINSDRLICLAAMLVGLLLYGYALAVIAATITNLDSFRVRYQERVFAVAQFFKERDVNKQLQDQVFNQLSMLWERYRGEWMPTKRRLMHDIPLALQQDIIMEDMQVIIRTAPIFRDLDDSFLRILCTKIDPYMFAPGEVIVYEGVLCREMCFVRRGICQIVSPSRVVLAEIGPGQYFGVIAMLFGQYQKASLIAKSHVEILQLKLVDFNKTLEDFPVLSGQMRKLKKNTDVVKKAQNQMLSKMAHQCKDIQQREYQTQVASKNSNTGVKFTQETPRGNLSKAYCNTCFKQRPMVFHTFRAVLPDGSPNEDYLGPFKSLNKVGFVLSRLFLMRKTFIPESVFVTGWSWLLFLLSLAVSITIPLQIAFLHENTWLHGFHFMVNIVFICNIYTSLHMAYLNNANVLVTHPLFCAANYLKRNFILDALAALPIELIWFLTHPKDMADQHMLALLHVNRIIMCYRVPYFFSRFESNIQRATGIVRAIKFFLFMIMFENFITCILFFETCIPSRFQEQRYDIPDAETETIGAHLCYPNSWLVDALSAKKLNRLKESNAGLYVISMYWATATSLSVGYGDMYARSNKEMIVASVAMILGIFFFGYVVASVASSLANADTQRSEYQDKMVSLESYMNNQGVPKNLQIRVFDHYEHVWQRTRGMDPKNLLDGIPWALWGDVSLNLYKDILSKITWFQEVGENFIMAVSKCLKPMLILKGENIYQKDDIGNDVYFIHKGIVDVFSETSMISVRMDVMKEGQSFGEDAWLFNKPRPVTLMARVNCDLFVLTKNDLDSVLECYPTISQRIRKAAVAAHSMAKRHYINAKAFTPMSMEMISSEEAHKPPPPSKRNRSYVPPEDKIFMSRYSKSSQMTPDSETALRDAPSYHNTNPRTLVRRNPMLPTSIPYYDESGKPPVQILPEEHRVRNSVQWERKLSTISYGPERKQSNESAHLLLEKMMEAEKKLYDISAADAEFLAPRDKEQDTSQSPQSPQHDTLQAPTFQQMYQQTSELMYSRVHSAQTSPKPSPQTSQHKYPLVSSQASPQISQLTSQQASQHASQHASPLASAQASPQLSTRTSQHASPEISPQMSQHASPLASAQASPQISNQQLPSQMPDTSHEESEPAHGDTDIIHTDGTSPGDANQNARPDDLTMEDNQSYNAKVTIEDIGDEDDVKRYEDDVRYKDYVIYNKDVIQEDNVIFKEDDVRDEDDDDVMQEDDVRDEDDDDVMQEDDVREESMNSNYRVTSEDVEEYLRITQYGWWRGLVYKDEAYRLDKFEEVLEELESRRSKSNQSKNNSKQRNTNASEGPSARDSDGSNKTDNDRPNTCETDRPNTIDTASVVDAHKTVHEQRQNTTQSNNNAYTFADVHQTDDEATTKTTTTATAATSATTDTTATKDTTAPCKEESAAIVTMKQKRMKDVNQSGNRNNSAEEDNEEKEANEEDEEDNDNDNEAVIQESALSFHTPDAPHQHVTWEITYEEEDESHVPASSSDGLGPLLAAIPMYADRSEDRLLAAGGRTTSSKSGISMGGINIVSRHRGDLRDTSSPCPIKQALAGESEDGLLESEPSRISQISSHMFARIVGKKDYEKDRKPSKITRCCRGLKKCFSSFKCDRNMLTNFIQHIESKNNYVIKHDGRKLHVFKETVSWLNISSILLTIFMASFHEQHPVLLFISYLVDVIMVVDFYINFHVTSVNQNGQTITSYRQVKKKYRQSSDFWIDLLPIIPVEVFALFFLFRDMEIAIHMMLYLRCWHTLRLIRLLKYFRVWEQELKINLLFVRSIKFIMLFSLVTHTLSCIWYAIACPVNKCLANSWYNYYTITAEGEMYVTTLYWTIETMTSTGYGDVAAHTLTEMVYASFVMIVGKMTFGFILASFASTLSNAGKYRVQYDLQIQSVRSHMEDQGVPDYLHNRVVNYFNYIWMRNKGKNQHLLLNDAPICLRAEVYLSVTRTMLETIELFESVSESFLRRICQHVVPMFFVPGDYIVKAGDIGKHAYYIHKGEVDVICEATHHIMAVLKKGDVFGEVGLVGSLPRRITVRAVTHVDMYSLSKKSLDHVLSFYPEMKRLLGFRAAERFGKLFEHCGVTLDSWN